MEKEEVREKKTKRGKLKESEEEIDKKGALPENIDFKRFLGCGG